MSGLKTLEKVLRESTEKGQTQEFRLVAIHHESTDEITFYVHPQDKDGETGDFVTRGVMVIPLKQSATSDRGPIVAENLRKFVSELKEDI